MSSDTKRANLFIVGAPKCGTTTLMHWLSQHPSIFSPEIKEPHFYNDDSNHRILRTEFEYLKLYDCPQSFNAKYRLDSSVWYFYSSRAINRIEEKLNKSAKYIVCLRDPAEMAVSLHQEMFMGGSENVKDFWRAWDLQETRALGKCIPGSAHESKHLQYRDICSLGKYSEMLSKTINDPERLLFVSLNEMNASPLATLERIYAFLGIQNCNQSVQLDVFNKARKPKSYWLDRFFKKLLALRYGPLRWLPQIGLLKLIKAKNVNGSGGKINELRPEDHERLRVEFKEDLELLEAVTGKDISCKHSELRK